MRDDNCRTLLLVVMATFPVLSIASFTITKEAYAIDDQ